jgi:hypothetical protein
MNGSHHPRLNSEGLVENHGDRCQTVCLSISLCHVEDRPLTVQLALLKILSLPVYVLWLTPYTTLGTSLLGAEINTFLAPPCVIWTLALSLVVIFPVDSITNAAPAEAQSTYFGSRCEKR